MITITAEQIERVNLILSGVPGGIEKALSSTIRRANNTVRSETLKGITTVYAITRQNVRAETTIKVRTQSSDGGIVGTVLFAGHKIPLYRFNVSPTIPIQRATVSAAVLAGNGRTPFQDAFIARMQSGHTGMFERDGSKRLPNSTGRYVQQAVKHVLVVNPKKFAPGKLAPASSAEASGEYPVTYYATYIDGKKVLEIDILNFIYYVNGVDYLEDVRKALGK